MKRKCEKIPIDELIKEFDIVNRQNVSLYIDTEKQKEAKAIVKFLKENSKKLKDILKTLCEGSANENLYGNEEVDRGSKDVTAMKFSGKFRNNKRIYCKEFYHDGKKVVMITMFSKKVQTVQEDKKLKNRISIIGGYDYEF